MMKRHARFLGSMVAGLVLLSSAIAFADSYSVPDASGDGTDVLDIRSAKHGHTTTGKLVHTVVTYGRFGARKAGTISVNITTPDNDYSVSTYGIWDDDAQTYLNVQVKRPSEKSIKYIFPPSRIGSPASYDWFVVTTPGYSCPLCPDYAPNAGGTVTHDL
jgi:hypothetical protein